MFKSTESSSLAPVQSSHSQPQAQASSSSSDGVSSQYVVPFTSAGVSSQPIKYKDDEDNRDWNIDVIGMMQASIRYLQMEVTIMMEKIYQKSF
ncbi:hypothetical protein H5410_016442 [Solanum commersonii]|uniref:Uncharacterized protein n=1 Tax=Solanum commersonii TaxID=4109 RepID=A0A9J5ZXD8_SOLCO|nr:hypothetical protein H5410_016442 [Solanum commersonii]